MKRTTMRYVCGPLNATAAHPHNKIYIADGCLNGNGQRDVEVHEAADLWLVYPHPTTLCRSNAKVTIYCLAPATFSNKQLGYGT
jgi:hypothetical protein